MSIRLALGLRTLGKLRKKTYSAPEFLQRMLGLCKEQLKINSSIKLKLADNTTAPLLCGFLRPVIILPSRYVEQFSQPELRLMLIHELAHWKYRDTWVLFAKQLIEVIFFFHPMVWYAGKQVVKEAEVACDNLVVALSKESTTYANCLMQILQQAAGTKPCTVGRLAVGGTVTAHRIRKLLKEGSRMISIKIKPQTIMALVLVALLGLPSCFVAKGGSAKSTAVPSAMVGTWFFDNPAGDNEQMAIFDDGRVVVLYSNGHSDETYYENGFISLAEYDNVKVKMTVGENNKLLQYADDNESFQIVKKWMRIDSEPRINLLKALTGSDNDKTGVQTKLEGTDEEAKTPYKPLGEYEYGAVVRGKGKDIQGEVHISNISYSGGNFWFHGIPAHLEKWMNARSKVHVNFIVQGGKMVYLSWPPKDWSQDRIQGMSELTDSEGLFKQPMLLMSGLSSNEVKFTQDEIEALRKYLIEKEGFLFIDDDTGGTSKFYQSVCAMLRLALPEFPIMQIPNNHEIYTVFYEMGGPPSRNESNKKNLEGIIINNKLTVVISDRGYWNALIGRGPYAPGVMRFCTNMVIYAITHGGISDYSKYKP